MPTFDGGHYFLTALVPVRTDIIHEGHTVTSPVHALRKRLSMMPTAADTPDFGGGQSPFARNRRNHFARLVVIEDVAYNGRNARNTLVSAARGTVLTVAQPEDHLTCPFLLIAVDFDAKNGSDAERDSYLQELWSTMGGDLRALFQFCQGFESNVTDGASFAAYIARCQLETTMSFNDYYVDPLDLPTWPSKAYKLLAIVGALATVLGLVAMCPIFARWLPQFLLELRSALALTVVGITLLVVAILMAYPSVMSAGRKPFRAAPDSDLPTVLKALYLQRKFTRFAIDSQMQAAGTSPQSAQKLYDDFAAFVAANKPRDLKEPTQAPGVIGI